MSEPANAPPASLYYLQYRDFADESFCINTSHRKLVHFRIGYRQYEGFSIARPDICSSKPTYTKTHSKRSTSPQRTHNRMRMQGGRFLGTEDCPLSYGRSTERCTGKDISVKEQQAWTNGHATKRISTFTVWSSRSEQRMPMLQFPGVNAGSRKVERLCT